MSHTLKRNLTMSFIMYGVCRRNLPYYGGKFLRLNKKFLKLNKKFLRLNKKFLRLNQKVLRFKKIP
jgi:hypothetical protein